MPEAAGAASAAFGLFVSYLCFINILVASAVVVASCAEPIICISVLMRLDTQEEVSHGSRCAVVADRHSNSDHTHYLAARRAARVMRAIGA